MKRTIVQTNVCRARSIQPSLVIVFSATTASSSLLDTLMPTLRDYDANGILKSTTEPNGERLTSFDSFMQELDEEYDKRKQAKVKSIQKKPSNAKKTTTAPTPVPPPAPLTLDGPIRYRDTRTKKKPTHTKKAQPKAKSPGKKKKPVAPSSSSSEDDERGETDPSQIVYDEDEAW